MRGNHLTVECASSAPSAGRWEALDANPYRDAIAAFTAVASAQEDADSRDAYLRLVARKMCELIGAGRCSLYLRDDETGLYRGQVAHADRDVDSLIKRLIGGVEADRFTREIVRTRCPVVIDDAQRDARAIRSTMREWRVRSMMGVPIVLRDQVLGIFYLDSEDEQRAFSVADRDLAMAFADLAAVAIFQSELIEGLNAGRVAVSKQNQALRRAAALDDRLARLVIDGGGLGQIVDTVAELTKKQAVLYDADMASLAASGVESVEVARGDLMSSLPDALDPADGAPKIVGPFPRVGIARRLLVVPVVVDDSRWATLALFENGDSFNAFDSLICRRVARVVALEMSAERRAIGADRSVRDSLAAELISRHPDLGRARRRADLLGLRLDDPHVVCVLVARAGGHLPEVRTAAATLAEFASSPPVLTTPSKDGVVMIVPLPADKSGPAGTDQIREQLEAACLTLEPEGRLVAGLSTPCRLIEGYHDAFEQAGQVVTCIEAYSPRGASIALSAYDLGPARLLLANTDLAEADRFTEQTVGVLLADNVPPELFETLVCFFEKARSVRRSAVRLGVHENTVRYRLSRIEELTGLAVTVDSDAQLSFQIALLILRLKGTLPRPEGDAKPLDELDGAGVMAKGKAADSNDTSTSLLVSAEH